MKEGGRNSCSDRISLFEEKTPVEENKFSAIAGVTAFSHADLKKSPNVSLVKFLSLLAYRINYHNMT
jgi:hypothetical protein